MYPQQATEPSPLRAQLSSPPPAISTTSIRPETCTGSARFSVVSSPSWPWSFLPQHHTVPSALSAQVWDRPALMSATQLQMLPAQTRLGPHPRSAPQQGSNSPPQGTQV